MTYVRHAAVNAGVTNMNGDLNHTQFIPLQKEQPESEAKKVLQSVYAALLEKGYNPINQIVGYIMSGDPTYITSYQGARSMIMRVERDEIVEELLRSYIDQNLKQ